MPKLDKVITDKETFERFLRARSCALAYKYHFDGYELNKRQKKSKEEPKYLPPVINGKTRKFIRNNIDEAHYDLLYVFGNPASARLRYKEGQDEPQLLLYRYMPKYNATIYVCISHLPKKYPDGSIHHYYVVTMHEAYGKLWKLNISDEDNQEVNQ